MSSRFSNGTPLTLQSTGPSPWRRLAPLSSTSKTARSRGKSSSRRGGADGSRSRCPLPRASVMTASYLYAASRTPFGRFGGALAGVRPDDLAASALRGVLSKVPELDRIQIDEVVLGNANGAGEDNRNVARMASLLADLPV